MATSQRLSPAIALGRSVAVLLAVALAVGSATAAPRAVNAPDHDRAPLTEPAYRDVAALERRGFPTGLAPGAFSSGRSFNRWAFARVTGRFILETAEGWLAKERLALAGPDIRQPLDRLIREFSPELISSTGGVGGAALGRPAPWPDSLPLLTEAERKRHRQRGAERARKEWSERGAALQLVGQWLPGWNSTLDPVTGFPMRPVFNPLAHASEGEVAMEEAYGHDAEVYRLVAERGVPSFSRRPWLGLVTNLPAAWQSFQSPLILNAAHPSGELREGGTLRENDARTVAIGYQGRQFTAELVSPAEPRRLEAARGPAAADLLFLKYPTTRDGKLTDQYECVDLRTGDVLCAFNAADPVADLDAGGN